MAASGSQNGIQLLLAAEQEAQHIVNAARTAKQNRLKQAKEEAEKDIADFRAQMETEFQKKVSESSGDSGANMKRLEQETEEKISHLKEEASRVSPDVVSMLLRLNNLVAEWCFFEGDGYIYDIRHHVSRGFGKK